MTIKERIQADLKNAILNKDAEKKGILRVLIGEFDRVDKNVDDNKALSIIKKMYQNAVDSGNKVEADIIDAYLPKMLSETESEIVIANIILDNGFSTMKDMGEVMKAIKDTHGATIDGKYASTIVRKILN